MISVGPSLVLMARRVNARKMLFHKEIWSRNLIGRGRSWRGRRDTTVGAGTGPHPKTHLNWLNQDVAAGDFEAAYSECFRRRLRRAWRLIASQLTHQGKDAVSVGAVVVLF
jgi:hypothetical protein